MAKDTLVRIQKAALELFSGTYYDLVSVAQICRQAGVSNGVFYRYYSSKEEIFRDLLDDFLERFGAELTAVSGATRRERLVEFVEVVSGAVYRYAGQVTMFREGQYRDPQYERRLRKLYMDSFTRQIGREIDEADYLYALSGLRFINTRSLYHDLHIDHAVLVDILETGLFGESPTAELGPLDGTERIVVEPENSEQALIEAGIREFGRNGYFTVQVSDVVREAGLSVGTFYKQFESKEQFLAAIVYQIGHRTRRYLHDRVPEDANHVDREILGMWNFLSYFSSHREYYTIVREAEFVVPLAVKDYYNAFERGYLHSLEWFPQEKRQLAANFLMGLSHYLGIEVLFSERVTDPAALVSKLGLLLHRGLQNKEDK